jgi:ABC-type dipeptide/oligopeptide/nickel transport system permease subunit
VSVSLDQPLLAPGGGTRRVGELTRLLVLVLCALLVLCAVFAPTLISALGLPAPGAVRPGALNALGLPTGPSGSHPFGVDAAGRDVLSRVLSAERTTLLVAFAAMAAGVLAGGLLARAARLWRGLAAALSALSAVALAFPAVLLAVALSAACSGGGGCLSGTLTRGTPLVIAAVAVCDCAIVMRARPAGRELVRLGIRLVPQNVLLEAALSFLGAGVKPPTVSFGAMIAEAAPGLDTAWWALVAPGAALALTVLAFGALARVSDAGR